MHVVLTPAMKRELEQACHNQANWNDFGYWQGTGKKPDCFTRQNLNSRLTHTLNFPSDESANRWNAEMEKSIRYAGHLATGLLTLGIGVATAGAGWGILATTGAGVIAAVTKDEIQAKIPYPRMERGWSFTMDFRYQYTWSPHPWGKSQLRQDVTFTSKNHNGKVELKKSKINIFRAEEISDQLATKLASSGTKISSADY